ncbi:conserved hypothetical protein [Candida tropicalis MYA-3404]|uniref:SRP9 domain-containing protein n=1 Tax=Candida tropicalis (strain ATCC MYA-3404 / T1) TaxID=294747 RepID=C5MEV7_CANTT|nr:conserved hypothetical protein [Candida tropicalis MYA-3404]EER31817.1 conserved hypothetical protein [Candida tropicalis MYA-3404]KAG4405400.1 hypothetical protein JTP64_005436 [Candida tropicalis]
MPTVSSIDKFIELSTDLLLNYPTTTTLSITYTNLSKKKSTSSTSSTSKPSSSSKTSSTHGVNFKLYEPNSGKCIKYNTKKSKELSKLLNFIGPKGLNNDNLHVLGLASLMTNVKYEDNTTNNNQSLENTPVPMDVDSSNVNKLDETKPGSASTANAGTSSSSKKKNKKKKKKN